MGSPQQPEQVTLQVETFPELGCLAGNRLTEMRLKQDNSLLSRKTEELLSMNSIPENPADFALPGHGFVEATPSAILQRDAELKGKECPRCLIEAGKKLDSRHARMWSERKADDR